MNIILFGKPGSGKGTQANILKKEGFTIIATGDLIRREIKKQTPLGITIQEYVQQGLLVPDETVIELLRENMPTTNVLFDGFPRTLHQAQELSKKIPIKKAIFLHTEDEVIIERIKTRITVERDHKTISFQNKQEAEEYISQKGGVIVKRSDETEEVIKQRLETYRINTKPLIEYYKEQGVFASIDGSKSIEEVHTAIKQLIQE